MRQSHFLLGSDGTAKDEKPIKAGETHFEQVKRLNEPQPSIHLDHLGVAAGAVGKERFTSSYKYGNRMQA